MGAQSQSGSALQLAILRLTRRAGEAGHWTNHENISKEYTLQLVDRPGYDNHRLAGAVAGRCEEVTNQALRERKNRVVPKAQAS